MPLSNKSAIKKCELWIVKNVGLNKIRTNNSKSALSCRLSSLPFAYKAPMIGFAVFC